jgi:spermidine synthase
VRLLVLALFFLSGATGLVYQGVWFRHLQSLFGVTIHALAVVVAAFMGGLAAGSWGFGRLADRSASPLRLYGVLELGVGFLAPLVALGVAGIERLYVVLQPHFAGSLVALSLVRLALALLALLGPTVLMGGTLPALTVLFRRDAARRGDTRMLHRDLGSLYGLNTLGAVAGTALVGFVLLERIGLLRTTLAAAAVNVGIGLVSLWIAKRSPSPAAPAPAVQPTTTSADATPGAPAEALLVRYAVLAFAISGGLSLAYEVAWTRVLTQIIGSSTYAFSMILAGFLLGVGAGSMLLGRRQGGGGELWGLCAALIGIGATAALVVTLLVRLPDLQLRVFATVKGMGGVMALQFALCLLVVLLPTLCMGATFPLAAGFVARRARDVGKDIGRLYAGNTVGGIAGSMLAGFVALPSLGTQRTLLIATCGNLLLGLSGLALLWRRTASRPVRGASQSRARIRSVALGAAALAVVIVALRTPPWDPYVLDAGIAIGGPAITHGSTTLTIRELGRGSDILFYREGLNANISVRKDASQLYLKTNGKTDGTSRGDMPTQLMLGLLPSLVHPEPRRSLVIGLGTGATARTALAPSGLERLDVVEIEPAVIEAARRWFGETNAGVFHDPRAHIWVDDARAFLLTTREHYDIIVSEPSNPWIAGVANLFAVEHYRRCDERLAPGGILSQWLQTYTLRPELVRMVLASMHEVFPHLSVWSFRHGDMVVLGSREPLPAFDLARVESRLQDWNVRADVHRVLDVKSAAGLLGFHLLDGAGAARLAEGAELNTDDRPRLEFAAPLSLYLSTRNSNLQLLLSARGRMLPELAAGASVRDTDGLELARAALVAGRPADAEAWVRQALADAEVPRAPALALGGETAIELQDQKLAEARLEEALRLDPAGRDAACTLGLLRILQGRRTDAARLLGIACSPDPGQTPHQVEARIKLLGLVLQHGQAEAAGTWAAALVAQPGPASDDPALQSALEAIVAHAHLALRQPAEADRWARRALDRNPQCTAAWRVLGTLAFEARRYPEAIQAWERCVEYRQTDSELLVPLATACQRSGRRRDALRYASRVLAQDPANAAAKRLRAELQ